MKTNYIFICAVALFAAASCQKDNPVEGNQSKVKMTFTAELGEVESKTYLDGKQVKWTEGDKITVFDNINYTNAKFSVSEINGASAEFSGTTENTAQNFVAVYPYEAKATYDGTTLIAYVPNVQNAVANGFDTGLNLAVATSTAEEKYLSFKNVCCLLKITIPDNADFENLTAVSFSSREALTGKLRITFDENGHVLAQAPNTTEGLKEVSLVAADGGVIAPGTYYLVARPNVETYSTFSIGFNFSDGSAKVVTATGQLTTEKNKVVDFGTASLTKAKTFVVTNAPQGAFPMGVSEYTLETNIAEFANDVVRYVSRNTDIATVDSESGKVEFKGVPGAAVINAQIGKLNADGKFSASYSVPVVFNVTPGYYRDTYASWSTDTSNSTMTAGDGYATVTFVTSNSKGRADIKRGKTYINPQYPILCFRLDDMKEKYKELFTGESIKLDVNYGFPYNHPSAGTTDSGKIWWGTTSYPAWNYYGTCSDGSKVLVYDMSVFSWPNVNADSGYTKVLPKDEIVCFTNFKIVYADLAPWADGTEASYRFFGFNTFKTLDEAKAFYGIDIVKR